MRIIVTWSGIKRPRRIWEKMSEEYLARRGHQTALVTAGDPIPFKPDIVFATEPCSAHLADDIASKHGVPFVVQTLGSIPLSDEKGWDLIKDSLSRAARITAISESAKKHLLSTYTSKSPVIVCYQGVADAEASKYLNQSKTEDFIWVGSLETRKRPRIALEAVCEANVGFTVIGEDLINIADDYIPLGKDIEFLGGVSEEEKFQRLSRSRCLVTASMGEEFYIPAAEIGFYGGALIFPTWSKEDHWIEVFRELYGDLPYYYDSRYELPGLLKYVKEHPEDAAKRGKAIRKVIEKKGLTMSGWAERMEGILSSVVESKPESFSLEVSAVWADMVSLCRGDFCKVTCDLSKLEEKYGVEVTALHWSRRFEYPWVMLNASLGGDDVVLDAGGGRAPFQFLAAPLCREYHNFDIDESSIEAVRELAREHGHGNMVLTVGDLTERLPYPDGHFDKVLCLSTLEHISHPMSPMVDELIRVLKPGGLFLLTIDVTTMKAPVFNITEKEARELCDHLKTPWSPPPSTALVSTMTPNGIACSPKVVNEKKELLAIPIRVLCFKILKKAAGEEPTGDLQLYQQYLRGMIEEGRQS